jgi:hypothetical protein
MTELTVAHRQTERFHLTETADKRTRHLVDEWGDTDWLLPKVVASEFGLTTTADHIRAFATPHTVQPMPNSAGFYLDRIYARLLRAEGTEHLHVMHGVRPLLTEVYGRHLSDMRNDWQQGYFPRHGSLRLGGDKYDIYNYQPAFAFTGNVRQESRRDLRTGDMRDWLVADFDMSPVQDADGDFVPCHPDVPVVVLPSMSFERYVDRKLAVAHVRALQGSVAPTIAETYAPHLQQLLDEEALQAMATRKGFADIARLAFAHVF